MKVRARGVLVVAALTLGACSGDSAAPATTASDTTAPAPTTSAETVTPTIPTTTAVATTPPTTTPPLAATTAPPTVPATIPADLAQAQQDVIDATAAAWQAFRTAARDPQNEDKLGTLATAASGPTLERWIATLAELVTSGLIAVENPTTPASIEIYPETVVVDIAAGAASVEYCRIGSDLGIEVGGNPDGTDKIVINEVNAYHERSDLIFTNGRWLDNDGVLLEKFPGAATCAR